MIYKLTQIVAASLLAAIMLLSFSSVEAQTKTDTTGELTSITINPLAALSEESGLHTRMISVYPEESFGNIEEGDQVVELDLFRFVDSQQDIDPASLEGDNHLRIYAKMQSDDQLGSGELNWDQEVDDAQLIFEGSVEDIIGQEGGFKSFRFNEGPFEWGSDDDNFQLMFEYSVEEEQEEDFLWVNTATEDVPEFDNQQSYVANTINGFADDLPEQEDGLRPFIVLTVAEEAISLEYSSVSFSREIFPYNALDDNMALFLASNEGYQEANLSIDLEATGEISHNWDTILTLEHSTNQLIGTNLPIPDQVGNADVNVTIEETQTSETTNIEGDQEFSDSQSAYFGGDQPDGELQFQETDMFFLTQKSFDISLELEGIDIYIPDNSSLVGENANLVILNQDFEIVAGGQEQEIENADLGTFKNLTLENPLLYEEGENIFVGALIENGGEVIPVGMSNNFMNTSFILAPDEELFQTLSPNNDLLITTNYTVPDVTANLLNPEDEICASEDQEVTVEITNNSGSQLSDLEVVAQIEDNGQEETLSETTGTIDPEESEEITLGSFNSKDLREPVIAIFIDEEVKVDVDRTFIVPEAGFSAEAEELEVDFTADDQDLENYFWDFGDENEVEGEASTSHTYSQEGTYQVTLEVETEGGCENSYTQEVEVTEEDDNDTFLSERSDQDIEINVYPNPVEDNLTIEFPDNATGSAELKILGLSGKAYNSESLSEIDSKEHTIDVSSSSLSTGTYILQINQEGQLSNKMLLVK